MPCACCRLREVLDLLRTPVFLQDEVFFVEIFDNLAVPIAYGCEQVDYFDVRRERRILSAQEVSRGQASQCFEKIAAFHLPNETL
jgi:hypothetical protein